MCWFVVPFHLTAALYKVYVHAYWMEDSEYLSSCLQVGLLFVVSSDPLFLSVACWLKVQFTNNGFVILYQWQTKAEDHLSLSLFVQLILALLASIDND